MLKMLMLACAVMSLTSALAKTIPVKNIDELKSANEKAQPGDTVVLQNGTWNDVTIKLNCSGTEKKPIVFKAQTAGKVLISGQSALKLGGNYIVVDGLLFTSGYSPSSAVIDFRISKQELANHCRVTNTVINDFNKPKRMSEDYWISFSGKNNRLDHCSFLNKKNMGVLLAVILDDDRSRENFHSIDHNYFGVRLPLGSNGGEIIRVGVSEHCQFNSNTQIKDNFFEYCDGEAEVISIKSCSNVVSNNVFKQCQGSVVLRHGNDNTVTNNLFLGYGKESTGGVRIINRGQWVINNFFYKCRGETFRSPLVIMNGIPNSPANRYVQVTDAVVMNNTFVDCSPISLGEGSDAERTLPPANVLFAKNIFYNSADSFVFRAWDNISGIRFSENKISNHYGQKMPDGFQRVSFGTTKNENIIIPTAGRGINRIGLDSLMQLGKDRLPVMTPAPGFSGVLLIKSLEANAYNNCGAKWFAHPNQSPKTVVKNCSKADEVYNALTSADQSIRINLTGKSYTFTKPLLIQKQVEFSSVQKNTIEFRNGQPLDVLFLIQKKGNLVLNGLNLSLDALTVKAFSATDTTASPEHFNLKMKNVVAKNMSGVSILFFAEKSTFADSVVIDHCEFTHFHKGFWFADERDNKGYYNAEKITIVSSTFFDGKGVLLNIYRGGNDESTLGPNLTIINNKIISCTADAEPLLDLTGVQKTRIVNNLFTNSAVAFTLIQYKDLVRAKHFLVKNTFTNSGAIKKNQFVIDEGNRVEMATDFKN